MSNAEWGWSDRLRLNYAPMDATHEEFVALCAALADPDLTTFVRRLDALISHSIDHFEQENNWMRQYEFPPAQCHLQEHEAVLDIMREVRRRFTLGETDLAKSLAEELPHWFENHVDTMDNMLARYMSGIEAQTTEVSA